MQDQFIEKLSSPKQRVRIKAYKKLLPYFDFQAEEISKTRNINIQVRTGYRETDCSPSLAVYKAKRLSLPLVATVGYASLSAVKELNKTAEPSFIAFYSGAEVSLADENGKIVGAMAIGIPFKQAKRFDDELSEYRRLKINYIKKTVDKINSAFKSHKIKISHFEKEDVKNPADANEKAVYAVLADEIMRRFDSPSLIIGFLTEKLKFDLAEGDLLKLEDLSNPLYREDLACVLKSNLKIKTEAEKCKSVKHFVELTKANGAIPAAIFTGKKEDAESFIENADKAGFLSVIIEHGDDELAAKVYDICIEKGLLPLSRVLIDRSRDKFDAEFSNEELAEKFNECAYAVVGHEICTSVSILDGLFSKEHVKNLPDIKDRIKLYSRIGAKGKV